MSRPEDTDRCCRFCGRPIFRSIADQQWRLVYVEYANTVLCDARGMESGHELGTLAVATDSPDDDGTSGQDRESYTDDQDRESYVPAKPDPAPAMTVTVDEPVLIYGRDGTGLIAGRGSEIWYVSECCLASAKGSVNSPTHVCCRACYQPIDSDLGGIPNGVLYPFLEPLTLDAYRGAFGPR